VAKRISSDGMWWWGGVVEDQDHEKEDRKVEVAS